MTADYVLNELEAVAMMKLNTKGFRASEKIKTFGT
jgi:hypothetical protein